MKVIAVNGSPRKEGNTWILLNEVMEELKKGGCETEIVELGGKKVVGCIACLKCFEKKDGLCAVQNDCVNELIHKFLEADGIILGSPTYFADVTAPMKAVIERVGMVARSNDDMLKRKVGAAVVAARRAGSVHAFDSINHFFLIGQMIVCGSSYWNIGMGRDVGQVRSDQEGVETMRNLGRNMGWLLRKLGA